MLIPPALDRLHEAVMSELGQQDDGFLNIFAEFVSPTITRMLSCVAQAVDGSKMKYGGRAQAFLMLQRGELDEFRNSFYPRWYALAKQNNLLVGVDITMSDELVSPDTEFTTPYVDGLKLKELAELENPAFSGEIHLTTDAPWTLVYGENPYSMNVGNPQDPFARVFAYTKLLSRITKDFQQPIDIVQDELWETFWTAKVRYKADPNSAKSLPTKRYAFVF